MNQVDNPRARMLKGCRIVFVLESLELGGAERQAIILARALRTRTDADVRIFGLRGGPLLDACAEENLPCSVLASDATSLPRRARAIARALKQLRPDVLLPYTSFPNIVCGIVWRYAGARASIWGQRDPGVHRPRGLIGAAAERIAIVMTPLFVSNSAHGATYLEREFGVRADRIRVVPNALVPLHVSHDRNTTRASLGISDDAFVAVMAGHFAPEKKDHLTLLDAWCRALPSIGGARRAFLLLAGRHDAGYAAAKARTDALGIADSVRYLGEVKDVGDILAASDVGILSALREGMPNAVMEYMGAGLPIIATRIPGVQELLTEADAALVPLQNADALAAAIVSVHADPAAARLRANRVREQALDRLGKDRLVDTMADIIASVAK